jgi:hypothetical protein
MSYRILRHEREERCVIIDDDGDFGTFRNITPNLATNELTIKSLLAENCPIHSTCVNLDGFGCSSMCQYKSAFPILENKEELLCKLGQSSMLRKVILLSIENCPEGRDNCLTCEQSDPVIPICAETGAITKSHAYVRCRAIAHND